MDSCQDLQRHPHTARVCSRELLRCRLGGAENIYSPRECSPLGLAWFLVGQFFGTCWNHKEGWAPVKHVGTSSGPIHCQPTPLPGMRVCAHVFGRSWRLGTDSTEPAAKRKRMGHEWRPSWVNGTERHSSDFRAAHADSSRHKSVHFKRERERATVGKKQKVLE